LPLIFFSATPPLLALLLLFQMPLFRQHYATLRAISLMIPTLRHAMAD